MTLRLATAGESHGPALVAIVTGLPAGLVLDRDAIDADLIVNATPVRDELLVEPHAGQTVVDLAYGRDGGDTALVAAARAASKPARAMRRRDASSTTSDSSRAAAATCAS